MNTRHVSAVLCALLVAALLLRPAQGQSGFVIENADGRRDLGMAFDGGLTGRLANVTTRVLLEHANLRRDVALAAPPVPLRTVLDQVARRIQFEHVNLRRDLPIAAPPTGLTTMLNAVAARFLIDHANARRDIALVFPRALLNDTTRPVVAAIVVESVAGGIRVRWTTNEFAIGSIRYGSQPGSYPHRVDETHYTRAHELLLPAPPTGERLFYQIIVTDLSGNRTVVGERTVTGSQRLFLPSVRSQ